MKKGTILAFPHSSDQSENADFLRVCAEFSGHFRGLVPGGPLLEIIDAQDTHPTYFALFPEILHGMAGNGGVYPDIFRAVRSVAYDPGSKIGILQMLKHWKIERYKSILEDICANHDLVEKLKTKPLVGSQCHFIGGMQLIGDYPVLGVNVDRFPIAISIIADIRKELVFHELFHQFGVSEGYEVTPPFHAKVGCEKCWMQYLPWQGEGLCSVHLLENLTKKRKASQDLTKQRDKLEARSTDLATLKGLFRGAGFVNYASRVYLQNLCAVANQRFAQLTGNKLRLELTVNNSFEVRDFLNDGKLRSVKTLSGGQTFQAALSLALGLADSVQQIARLRKTSSF